jgi:transcriptional regulator with XRE-family HTH domain
MPRKSPYLVWIGERIATRRKARGLTQEELAAKAHISGKHLSEVERAESGPSLEMVHRLAKALGTTMPELTAEEPETQLREELLNLLRGKSERERNKALQLLRLFFDAA